MRSNRVATGPSSIGLIVVLCLLTVATAGGALPAQTTDKQAEQLQAEQQRTER